ncbi:MAG: DNA mismatch repair protein [Lachnospiraceae bacterium]|jgi:hypothetical protein|nr:DNA mismatch repair protein [Lachnospiraceae bacterium]
MKELSLLYPVNMDPEYKLLPDETLHDLSLEAICKELSKEGPERFLIYRIMSAISGKEEVIKYRCDVFEDVLRFPEMRKELGELLEKVDFMRNYKSFFRETDGEGIWELLHRLDEMYQYIQCIEAIYECLDNRDLRSEGFLTLKQYVHDVYRDHAFEELKKDVLAARIEASRVKSVTLGVNLNDRMEPVGIGVVSVNSKYFNKSSIISNFCDHFNQKDDIQDTTEWKKKYTYHTAGNENIFSQLLETTADLKTSINLGLPIGIMNPFGDGQAEKVIGSLGRAVSTMINNTVKALKKMLLTHITVNIRAISDLIPELTFYVRWAEYVEKLQEKGYTLCKPQVISADKRELNTTGIYNLKLVSNPVSEVVTNDLLFDREHRIYILTGANRGGKTTITQAVGIAYLMAQNGIYVPAETFSFSPARGIFTHFPADENQTMDLGRLGEESKRFREIFMKADSTALFLLNESFSTTSFEEGVYIAHDAVRALRDLGARTIYNTHLHKLAMEIEEINAEGNGDSLVSSLVAEAKEGKRSYRVRVGKPDGLSYARDIAMKYGVTYEQLMEKR